MSQNSDNNNKPRTNIFDLLPEVYRSDLNETLLETSYNRHLTKDDTVRVSGFIGQGNPNALVDRQIKEPTPFRQAYQLQPTMYTKIGSVDYVLTQQGFLKQLELMGVNINRLPEWGNTLEFNWVPPVNIDMLVNYFDYYWATDDPNDPPQYFTIENRCNKARSKVYSYENTINQKGATHPILSMDVKLNTFVIEGDLADIFTEGFVFFTNNTADVNLLNRFWTAASSTYDNGDDETTIITQENIAIVTVAGDPTPTTTEVGRLWYKSDTDELFRWNGATWIAVPVASIIATGDISLTQLLTIFQRDANCVCNEDFGWDLGLWDDGQLGTVIWNTALLASISYPTEAAWTVANSIPTYPITAVVTGIGGSFTVAGDQTATFIPGTSFRVLGSTGNDGGYTVVSSVFGVDTVITVNENIVDGTVDGDITVPALLDLWYDTTNDQLNQYYSGVWNLIFNSFSTVLTLTTGLTRWDLTIGCVAQELNQWSAQNKWINKTEVQSFGGVRRARIPIIEYNSTIELNEWAQSLYEWKYRALAGDEFESIGQGSCVQGPWRLELEPVKGYAAVLILGKWYVYLFEREESTMNRDIDHTDALTPGTKFRIRNDSFASQIYTVASSEYRKILPADSVNLVLAGVLLDSITDYYVTVVEVEEAVFTSALVGGGVLNTRVEPTKTSQGDVWRGYHVHWMLDANATTFVPTTGHEINPELADSLDESNSGQNPTYNVTPATAAVTGVGPGLLEIGSALAIFTSTATGTTTISLNFREAVAAYQIIDVGGTRVGGDATGLANDATVYTATATIDGVDYPIAITGSTAQTYGTLVLQISADLGAAGLAQLVSGNVRITSDTLGVLSSITLVDTGANPLFSSLTDFVSILSTNAGDGNYSAVPPSPPLQFDHSTDLQYDPTESRFYATPGSNELRVFINDIQQYGTYTENVANGAPNYTAIGSSATNLAMIPYVSSITFDAPLNEFDVVRIEVCPASLADVGMFAVPVRTVEDETAFALAVAAGTQPEYRSLSQYQRFTQVKTETNQYPLFNVYDICPDTTCDNTVVKASPLFAYKEAATCPINPNVRRRLFATSDGRDYTFLQYLLDRDDNILYGYRNLDLAPDTGSFWYNPELKQALQWTGQAWTDTVFVDTSGAILPINGGSEKVARVIVNSAVEPVALQTVEGAFWMDTTNEKLYRRSLITVSWVEQLDVIIATADQTLQTVWKNGDDHEYVPEYVNAEREPVPVGDPTGDWELLDQWFYNSEHKNKSETKYTQLVTHFRSIADGQTDVPGFLQGGVYTLTQNQYDLGIGGTIKDHNDSFDTLISAVNVTNTTPVGLMEWAEDQYTLGLLFTRDYFNSNITALYGVYTPASIVDQTGEFTDKVVLQYKLNDFLSSVYGDTTAYDEDTDVGMPNWITTAPILKLSEKHRPYLLIADTIELFHHDGHRSTVSYTPGEQDRYSRQIIAISDNRVANGKLGILDIGAAPTTESAFLTAFGGTEMRTGVYWYRVGGGFRTLYRFIPVEVTDAAPSFLLDGDPLPDGTRYYNILTNLVYIKVGFSWVPETGVPFDISTLWEEVNFALDFAQVELDIEMKLYEAVPDGDLVFDYSSLTPNASEQAEYDNQYERRFYAFVAERNIQAPLVNTTYSATNAFTWNYVNSIVTTPPRIDITPDSAGAWQELYTRWYGTPYPHLEPWKMQGYEEKPTWWDDEYLETSGSRRWIYRHSALIVGVNTVTETITVSGDRTAAFTPGTIFTISGSTGNDGVYTVALSTLLLGDTVITVTGDIIDPTADGFTVPEGMWENIRVGAIPTGRELPDGSGVGTNTPGDVSYTFNYFCVNIDDVPVGGYNPDEVFPPYLSSATVGFSTVVRSLFSNLFAEIAAPDADYLFGDGGPTEWFWTISSEYVYDIPIIAFLMQPARFLHSALGVNFIDVDSLQVETRFCQVYSHEDALFHGDIYNNDEVYSANGLNQWYVNFNRSSGYDTSADFRYLWAGWDPRQSYQFAGIIDTSTFEISSKYFDVISDDYNLILANTGVFRDMWAEGFEISVLNIPPALIQYNNQALWRFDLDSLAAVDRELNSYGVRLYPYSLDIATDEGTFYKYNIVDASSPSQRFYVPGDQTQVFLQGLSFDVLNSALNDGTYTTVSAVFEPGANRTRINVAEIVPSSVGDGQLDVAGFVSPWTTGQQVVVSSSRNLPAPLVNGVPYFIINTGPRTFQLAETYNNALASVAIDITTPGDGELRIGEISASFMVYGGEGNSREIWYHYAIDKTRVVSVTPPTVVQGMQTLINIFDGYAEYQRDVGEIFNPSTTADFDTETGRAVNWQFEIERFINWAYGLRRSRMQVADRFEFVLNAVPPTQELLFSSAQPVWQNGTPIVFTTTGSLPSPLIAGVPYYFVQTAAPGVFQVSITSNTTIPANILTLTTTGSGTMYVAQHLSQLTFPSLEVNPIRNNIWYDTPQGIMANVVTGPYTDIRVSQTIFDQHGRQLTPDKLNLYRLDKQTRIAIRPELTDDLSMIPTALRTDLDHLHLGGGHFFMEGYEHVILFNDYAVGGALIYDQFLGLHTERFNLDYFESANYNLRPTLGGYYLINGQFERNLEGSTVDLHNYYDTYNLRENTTPARYARHLLNYNGTENYLDLVNLNNKSQFLFYQGMIQYKGSVAGAKAYINSRRFVDAKVDEFWAWKIAEYGSPLPKVYPEIKLFSDDATQQDVRMHFLAQTETEEDTDVLEAIENDFIPIDFNVETRWELYPEQKSEIVNPLFLDAEVSSMYRVYVGTIAPTNGQSNVDYWYNPLEFPITAVTIGAGGTFTIAGDQTTLFTVGTQFRILGSTGNDGVYTVASSVFGVSTVITVNETIGDATADGSIPEFKTWDGTTWNVVTDVPLSITVDGTTTYVRLTPIFDTARVVQRKLSIPGDLREYETVIYAEGGGIEEFEKVNSEVISFQTVGFTDVMMLFTINPGFSRISPSKLLDKTANTVVDNVQLWDPARNHHSTVAIHNVDLQNAVDPAGYLNTLNPADVADFAWNELQVGRVWLDTEPLGYKMYYDDRIYPNVNDRLNLWGNLAEWGEVHVYEWTSSSVPPDEYENLVTSQATDLRPQRSKATGTARQTLFRRDRTPSTATIDGITSGSLPIDFTPDITGGTSTGLAVGDQGKQDINTTTTFVAGDDPRGPFMTGSGPFQATIFVDGVSYLISVTASSVPTYTDLITQITTQLLGSGTATIFDSDTIRITSATVGLGSTVIIQDINLFNNLADAPSSIPAQTNGISTTYTAIFTLDGINYEVAVLGDDAQDFDDLLAVINPQISGFGALAIVGGDLILTSTTVGTESTVAITDVDLFSEIFLTNAGSIGTAVDGTYGKVKVPTSLFPEGTTVLFTSTDTLPDGLESSVNYFIVAVDDATYFPTDDLLVLVDAEDVPVLISTSGTGTLSAVPAFSQNWSRQPFIRERMYGGIDVVPGTFEPTLVLDSTIGFAEEDVINVYINDILVVSGYTLTSALTVDLIDAGITIEAKDIIDVVRPLRSLTPEEESFDPDVEDDGTIFTQWLYDYEYSVFTTFDGSQSTVPVQTYYFWVENSQFQDDTEQAGISAQEVAQQLTDVPTPYFVVQLPKDDPALQAKYGYGLIPYGSNWSLAALAEQFLIIPVFYRQAILRKAASDIAQDDRFVWKFTRDLTLRTSLNNRLNLKNKHQEWFMIRREQPATIPRALWDSLTEALMGYKLNDSSVRVPSLTRELYDALYGTSTRFGLGEDEAFVNATYALTSILGYLTNPDIDFQTVDIDAFFATYSFDTPEDIRTAMDVIYNSFGTTHVNNIWFETLSDALATQAKYKELFKTSWIALHGIRVLEVGGLFDD